MESYDPDACYRYSVLAQYTSKMVSPVHTGPEFCQGHYTPSIQSCLLPRLHQLCKNVPVREEHPPSQHDVRFLSGEPLKSFEESRIHSSCTELIYELVVVDR